VTHFHFDHTGNLAAFPNSTYTLQRAELEFRAGPRGRKPAVAASVEARDVAFLVDAVSRGRARCIEGDQTVRPGISARSCPGTARASRSSWSTAGAAAGLWFSRRTRCTSTRRWSATCRSKSSPTSPGCTGTYQVLRDLEQQGAVIVAGHDPAIVSRFAPLPGSAPGTAVRIGWNCLVERIFSRGDL
jgi:hypothetical protein